MKYICLGYMDESQWQAMPKAEQEARVRECLAYEQQLRRHSHLLGVEPLQVTANAVALRWQEGRTLINDGPFSPTREQIGGLLVLEARDLNHAIQLIAEHPGLRFGAGFEIRPAETLGPFSPDTNPQTQAPDSLPLPAAAGAATEEIA